jgi:two-component system sensor histidine kinase TctE
LTGLKVLAQQAARENDPEQLRYALQSISSSVDRASHLVNQLLALARAEASEQSEQALVPVDLNRLLHEIVEQWFVRALDQRIDLGYEASGRACILGNVFLLRELINNLLDNAVRYTPDEGRITARVVEQGDFVVLEIEDSGIGISEDEASKVFDRFYRVEGTGVEGSGLGLAIVREIAELHLAAASLRPRPATDRGERAAGAIARVVFPAHRALPAIPAALEPPQECSGRAGERSV